MELTEQQKEIALLAWQEVSVSTSVGESIALKFAGQFLAALPKPEPVGWFKYDKVSMCWHPQYEEYANTVGVCQGWKQLYTEAPITPPQPDDARDAERYRWLRDSENQVTEDDPCVSDSFFNAWFGEELDKVIDEMIARNAAVAAAKGEV